MIIISFFVVFWKLLLFRSIPEAASTASVSNYKSFTSDYLEAKVRELQPHGSDYLKASKMFDVGRSMILCKMLGKSHSVFKV